MVELIDTNADPQSAASEMIRAINRGEGVFDSRRLRGKLALQVRQVDGATVRSYRVFPAAAFHACQTGTCSSLALSRTLSNGVSC